MYGKRQCVAENWECKRMAKPKGETEKERAIDIYMVEKMSSSRKFSYNRDSNNISSLDIFLSFYSLFHIDTSRNKRKISIEHMRNKIKEGKNFYGNRKILELRADYVIRCILQSQQLSTNCEYF